MSYSTRTIALNMLPFHSNMLLLHVQIQRKTPSRNKKKREELNGEELRGKNIGEIPAMQLVSTLLEMNITSSPVVSLCHEFEQE